MVFDICDMLFDIFDSFHIGSERPQACSGASFHPTAVFQPPPTTMKLLQHCLAI
jgi:hypothetical protein